MCGIAGIFGERARDEGVVRAMTGTLVHRGPDDGGMWVDPAAGIALGHRRLSVVDLSPAGRQPMHSADGRFVLTFNGEIYNFDELRSSLEACGTVPLGGWHGHSDTEVFLQAICAWGVDTALEKSAGMFAFALWDRRERLLTLARDRFGEKPLYYGWAGKDFVFGSELKALRTHPQFDQPINRGALALFAARTHIPAPLSIYRRVFKLPPGCLLEVQAKTVPAALEEPPEEGRSGNIRLRRYWKYREVARRGLADPIEDEATALTELENVLTESIRRQTFADVPVGAFLSGGIDSSTIAALCQSGSSVPVRTFSIGFEDSAFNEAEHAKTVARHLGTLHHEHYVTATEARDVIPLLPAMYDEPFADSSQIPTYLVSRFAREQVTVALTGDGGDELFAGYNRHIFAPRLWKQIGRLPKSVRSAAASIAQVPPWFWNGAARLVPGERQPHLAGKLQKLMGVAASAASFQDIHRILLEEWRPGRSPVLADDGPGMPFDLDVGPSAPDAVRMMYCDAVSYLPDDILCKVDRASMAVGLETRVPFLDPGVAEVAARIPLSMKVRKGSGKVILRKLLERHVPKHLVDRPKAGFALPVGEWLKGPLREWAEDLLDPHRLRTEGWFDHEATSARWRDHLAGRRNSTEALWAVLMFQSWLREQRITDAVAA